MVRVGIPTPYTTSSAQANSESFLEGYQVLASLALQKLGTKFWRIHYQILVISLGAPRTGLNEGVGLLERGRFFLLGRRWFYQNFGRLPPSISNIPLRQLRLGTSIQVLAKGVWGGTFKSAGKTLKIYWPSTKGTRKSNLDY